jgi:hypothetical protein
MVAMKFNLRDLLWLVLVIAIGASWFADRRRQSVEVQQIKETHERFWETQYAAHMREHERNSRTISTLQEEVIWLKTLTKK